MPKINNLDGPNQLDLAIGQRIRERRRALGVSQQELGALVGITFQQVQKYERGANRVSFSRLVEIAGALRCRMSDLAEGLDGDHAPGELKQVNRLMETDGALELLEAYAALPGDGVRRALLRHTRALTSAISEDAGETEPR